MSVPAASSPCPQRPDHPSGVITPFSVSLSSFEIRTLATLWVWSLMWKKSGTSPLHTLFLILFLSQHTTAFTRSLKRRMESSRSWLHSW